MAPKGDGQAVPAWSTLRGTLGTEQTTEQDGERATVRISVPKSLQLSSLSSPSMPTVSSLLFLSSPMGFTAFPKAKLARLLNIKLSSVYLISLCWKGQSSFPLPLWIYVLNCIAHLSLPFFFCFVFFVVQEGRGREIIPKGAQPVSGFDSLQIVIFISRFSHPKHPNKSIILTYLL